MIYFGNQTIEWKACKHRKPHPADSTQRINLQFKSGVLFSCGFANHFKNRDFPKFSASCSQGSCEEAERPSDHPFHAEVPHIMIPL